MVGLMCRLKVGLKVGLIKVGLMGLLITRKGGDEGMRVWGIGIGIGIG